MIIEGESGANDPVGIALLVSLLAVGGDLNAGAVGAIAGTFALQMAVGAAAGVGGGWLMLQAIRKLPLPSEALYPLRTLAISLALYGVATVAHCSGFLAVVAFSAVVQGGLVPSAAARCRVRMHDVEPRPFALGMRLRDQPDGAREYRVEAGAPAVGMTVAELHDREDVWVSLVVRDGAPVPLGADTVFRTGDEVLLLVEPTAKPGPAFAAG